MAWDFETEPEFQRALDWMDAFVREEAEPLDHLLGQVYHGTEPRAQQVLPPLKEQVNERGHWPAISAPSSAARATAS